MGYQLWFVISKRAGFLSSTTEESIIRIRIGPLVEGKKRLINADTRLSTSISRSHNWPFYETLLWYHVWIELNPPKDEFQVFTLLEWMAASLQGRAFPSVQTLLPYIQFQKSSVAGPADFLACPALLRSVGWTAILIRFEPIHVLHRLAFYSFSIDS